MKTKIFFILICNFLICNILIAQSINTTLGTLGVFTIKDASNNYFTLSQSTGQVNILRTLRLEFTTSSTTGVIYKGTSRFLHDYQAPGTNGQNTFLGVLSGNFTMGGTSLQASFNTGIGYLSLNGLTTGSYNTAVGWRSLYSNTTGYGNTAVGFQSLFSNVDGRTNTAVGDSSLYSNTTGTSNTAVGNWSLFSNVDGTSNTAVGRHSLYDNINGFRNTAFGYFSLNSNISGDNNTALGSFSGTTIITGGNLTCLGYNAEPTSSSAINQITLGNSSVTSLRCNVTTITSLSDARDKKNIADLSLGIDFLMKLKPRIYYWDKREWYDNNISDGSKMKESPTAGFIAQELDEAQTTAGVEWLNLVLKDNPEKWEATPGNLLPIVVKAIQDLKAENSELSAGLLAEKSNNEKLTAEIESLKDMKVKLAELEQVQSELYKIIKSNSTNDVQSITVSDNK